MSAMAVDQLLDALAAPLPSSTPPHSALGPPASRPRVLLTAYRFTAEEIETSASFAKPEQLSFDDLTV